MPLINLNKLSFRRSSGSKKYKDEPLDISKTPSNDHDNGISLGWQKPEHADAKDMEVALNPTELGVVESLTEDNNGLTYYWNRIVDFKILRQPVDNSSSISESTTPGSDTTPSPSFTTYFPLPWKSSIKKRKPNVVRRGISRWDLEAAIININIVQSAQTAVYKNLQFLVEERAKYKIAKGIRLPTPPHNFSIGGTKGVCGRCEYSLIPDDPEFKLESKRHVCVIDADSKKHVERYNRAAREFLRIVDIRREVLYREQVILSGRKPEPLWGSEPFLPRSNDTEPKKRPDGRIDKEKEPATREDCYNSRIEDVSKRQWIKPLPTTDIDSPICPNIARYCMHCRVPRCPVTEHLPPPGLLNIGGNNPQTGSSSSKTCAPSRKDNTDILHMTNNHLALGFTLERIVKKSQLPSQKDAMNKANSVFFSFNTPVGYSDLASRTNEYVRYWTDLDLVLDQWDWLIPFARPTTWDEFHQACNEEVRKLQTRNENDNLLADFNYRFIGLGPLMTPSDYEAVGRSEDSLEQDIERKLRELRKKLQEQIRSEMETIDNWIKTGKWGAKSKRRKISMSGNMGMIETCKAEARKLSRRMSQKVNRIRLSSSLAIKDKLAIVGLLTDVDNEAVVVDEVAVTDDEGELVAVNKVAITDDEVKVVVVDEVAVTDDEDEVVAVDEVAVTDDEDEALDIDEDGVVEIDEDEVVEIDEDEDEVVILSRARRADVLQLVV